MMTVFHVCASVFKGKQRFTDELELAPGLLSHSESSRVDKGSTRWFPTPWAA
jgi:hypothetical protein